MVFSPTFPPLFINSYELKISLLWNWPYFLGGKGEEGYDLNKLIKISVDHTRTWLDLTYRECISKAFGFLACLLFLNTTVGLNELVSWLPPAQECLLILRFVNWSHVQPIDSIQNFLCHFLFSEISEVFNSLELYYTLLTCSYCPLSRVYST